MLSRKFFGTHHITHPTIKTHARPQTHSRYRAIPHNNADAGLAAITATASRRKSVRHIIRSSARQQRVSSDGSSVRCRWHFANNRYTCCSFSGSRLSPTPQTPLDEGSPRVNRTRCSRKRHNTEQSPTHLRLPYNRDPSHQQPPERAQHYEFDPMGDKKEALKSSALIRYQSEFAFSRLSGPTA